MQSPYLSPTRSIPPGTATPNCLTCQLTSFNRGRHSRMTPAVMNPLHVMPTQTGLQFSTNLMRVDCTESCQNSGGNTSGSSTIHLHKAVMPRPNSSTRRQCG